MTETMHDCYLSQFCCMKNILDNRKEILGKFVDYYTALKPDRVYLLGSGTSYNACAAAVPFMEKALAVEITPVVPSSIGKLYGKRPLVIAVSQSGRSTNTVSAMDKMKESGVPVVTLTDPQDTPVGNGGDLSVHLAAGNELIGPRTRGYTATVLTLYLMALEAGLNGGTAGESLYGRSIQSYIDTVGNGGIYYEACQKFYEANLQNLKSARKYIFAGKGTAAQTAQESALKVMETVCYPAVGYEYEEFLHGPVCCADEELALFLFLASDEDQNRMMRTAEILGKITKNCYLVTRDPQIRGENVLTIPSAENEDCSVFTDILISQLISAKMPQDLGKSRHPGVKAIFDHMGTKITNERR